jgi:enoyl-CoA hydratase/carnithine racemase
MSSQGDILVSSDANAIALVTLNRPDKRNAITLAMWQELTRLFNELGATEKVRVIVLAGAGDHFSAGADITEFSGLRNDLRSGKHYDAKTDVALVAVRDCRKPTIAAVKGYTLGGACALALACDLRVADTSTRMGIPAARMGIAYSTIECALLLRQVGLANAKRVLYCGSQFGIEDCVAMRLVDMVVKKDPLAQALALAAEIAQNAPLSAKGHKVVLEALASGSEEARQAEITGHIDRALESADYREAVRAFLEKRKPVFTGR